MVRNSLQYVAWKDYKAVTADRQVLAPPLAEPDYAIRHRSDPLFPGMIHALPLGEATWSASGLDSPYAFLPLAAGPPESVTLRLIRKGVDP